MAETRFNSDPSRIAKHLQQQTDGGRYMLNAPGPGENPCFIEDPQIILQKWGANLRTNTINIESELFNVNRPLSRDCFTKDEYKNFDFPSKQIQYPTCKQGLTDQTRTTNPAWLYRDLEQNNFNYLFLNPQENTCMPFVSYINTRIIEKDKFISTCNMPNYNNMSLLPSITPLEKI